MFDIFVFVGEIVCCYDKGIFIVFEVIFFIKGFVYVGYYLFVIFFFVDGRSLKLLNDDVISYYVIISNLIFFCYYG